MTGTRGLAWPIVGLLVVALVGVPWQGAALASEPEDRAAVAEPSGGSIRASAIRWASAESHRLERSDQGTAASPGEPCRASMAEKLAWLYALVGGSILLYYGPQEKEGDVWTLDGKSETVMGAGAIVISFALLRDIRKKGAAATRP